MKIIMISPFILPIPPYKGYGGIERAVYDICMEFSHLGHEIDLFASAKSEINFPNVRLHGFSSPELETLGEITDTDKLKIIEKTLADQYRRFVIEETETIADEADIINYHVDDVEMIRELYKHSVPQIISCHYNLNRLKQKELQDYGIFMTQSATQKDYFLYGDRRHTLQGIRVDNIPFSAQSLSEYDGPLKLEVLKKLKKSSRDYAVMISRIDKRKGQLSAIKIAKKAKIPLIIAGSPYLDHEGAMESSVKYFEESIKPEIDNENIFYFGNADEEEKLELTMYAKASIFPAGMEDVSWKEPFGRVIAENLAAGTPVIAYADGGAAIEQIVHGKNGFLFYTLEDGASMLKNINMIDRKICSDHARKYLSLSRFARDLEKAFLGIIDENKNRILSGSGKQVS